MLNILLNKAANDNSLCCCGRIDFCCLVDVILMTPAFK